jgi:hypothetical protein
MVRDPRYMNVKYYEDYTFKKVFTMDSNIAGIEYLVDDNGPTVFALKKPQFWQSSYFQQHYFLPAAGSLGILSGFLYYKSSNDPDYGDSFMPSMCLGSAITCTFASILSFCGVFTQDYASDIANQRMQLFKNRNLNYWGSLGSDLSEIASPAERRDFIFDQSFEDLVNDDSFATDLDAALEDDALNSNFHKSMKISMEDYNFIIQEEDSHLKELKLERLRKQWGTFQEVINRHPHAPPDFVIHPSTSCLSDLMQKSLRKLTEQIVKGRKQILEIKKENGED